MFRIYVHGEAQDRENVELIGSLEDQDVDAWVCPQDDPDRPVFEEAALPQEPGESEPVLFSSVEAAVRALVLQEVEVIAASEAWTRKAGKAENGGLNAKGRRSYTKGTLKKPVPRGPRHHSFCKRMQGMKKKLTGKKAREDPNSRINKSLRAWHC